MAARILCRSLSTPAKGAGKHSAPKKIYGLHGRYAEATYTAASKANLLDKVASELGAFKETMRKSPNFASFLANPSSKLIDRFFTPLRWLQGKAAQISLTHPPTTAHHHP